MGLEQLQDPATLRLHLGELGANELRVAQAAVRFALAKADEESARLRAAIIDVIRYNAQAAADRYGNPGKAEEWSCVRRLREALTDAQQPAEQPQAQVLLYEHEDGRYAIGTDAAAFTQGDPAWHRVGPVDVSALVMDQTQPRAAVPDAKAEPDGARYTHDGYFYAGGYVDGWNDCRAAVIGVSPTPPTGGAGQ